MKMNTTKNMTTVIEVVSFTTWTTMMSHDHRDVRITMKCPMTALKMLKRPFIQPLMSFIGFQNVSVACR